jgi:hypothetical protein
MTSSNPVSPNYLSPEIIAKLNAHADRSMDRLFADLDEILSGDLSTESDSTASPHPPSSLYPQSTEQFSQVVLPGSINIDRRSGNQQPIYPQTYLPYQPPSTTGQPSYSPPPPPAEAPPPEVEAAEPAKRSARKSKKVKTLDTPAKTAMPLWMKLFLGIGVGAVGLSTVLLWAIDRHKISLPKALDLSVPFSAKSSISQDDTKFAEYMRRSISKIERAQTTPAATNASAAAPAVDANNPGTIASTTPANPGPTVTLLKVLPNGDKPGAQFELLGQLQIFHTGEKIGNSEWMLITVAKSEAIVKKSTGEIRSVFVGQKF